jgi:hypothetical protein
MMTRAVWAALPFAVLLAEVLLFFRKALFTARFVFPWDFRGYHLPLNQFLARSLGEGTLPFWDPFTYCGFPQYANPQAQTFYPPALLFAWIGALRGEDRMASLLHWQAVLHVFLGGVFVYLLMRRRGVHTPAAVLAASVFQLGGFHACHMQHLGLVNALAWVPLAMLFISNVAVVAFAVSMSFLAGFPPAMPVAVTTLLVYGGLRKWPRLMAAFAWAAVLSAVQLLPSLELVRLTRASSRYQEFGLDGGMLWQGLVTLVWPNFTHAFDPENFNLPHNSTFHYLFSGVTTIALAIYARPRRLWLSLAFFAIVLLGFNGPLIPLIYHLAPGPVWSAVYFEYFSFPLLLTLAALAGHGAARLSPRLAAAACSIAVAELMLINSGMRFHALPKADEPAVTRRSFEGSEETLRRLRMLTDVSLPPQRIDIQEDSMNWANSAPITKVATPSGNDPLVLDRYQSVRRLYTTPRHGMVRYLEPENLDSPLLSMTNTGFLMTWTTRTLSHPKWKYAEDLPGHRVYRNESVLPRFWMPSRILRSASKEDSLRLLADPVFDPPSTAIVETGAALHAAGGSARVTSYTPQEVRIEADAPADSFLASSESHYPGWTAEVDGVETPIYITNTAFRGVPIPKGRHEVRMRFEPNFLPGLAITIAAATLMIARAAPTILRKVRERFHAR